VLKLRRAIVVGSEPLEIELDGERRPAWADAGLLGPMREGDEVIVNVEARDLGLGSGGFDVVHVNLTRGLEAPGAAGEHVMKLNYTSLQHPVAPVEGPFEQEAERPQIPVLVIPLHGHLGPAAWAASQGGARDVGYVQSAGGALPGAMSRDVATLRDKGLLGEHLTAGPAYGGADGDAISVLGALAAAAARGWGAVNVGPGPGIIGSETRLGNGGIAAVENAHAALSLFMRALLAPRLSSADPRERHHPVSHHTISVLLLLLGSVEVPAPAGEVAAQALLRGAAGNRHRVTEHDVDLAGYAASDLPQTTMGRTLEEDPLFFSAALAAGTALAVAVAG